MNAAEVAGTLQDIIDFAGNDVLICVKEDDSFSKPREIVSVRFERTLKDDKFRDVITLIYSDKAPEAE